MSRLSGRYAPSPTGEMHLGNASSALLAWWSIRSRGGRFVLRMEDLDRQRCRDEYDRQLLDDLRWLGIDWDEGPDIGGPLGPYTQSERNDRYRQAAEQLHRQDRLYPCFCTRKEIAAAASAPQEPGEQRRYPGICRGLATKTAEARIAAGESHAWRFRVPQGSVPSPGDFVVHRADGVIAYQLAVVVDDIAMEITEVVRGADLLDSTAWQRLLFEAFDATPPQFSHVPLLLGPDNVRLSKRHGGITLRELRERGFTAEVLVGRLLFWLGLADTDEPTAASDWVSRFDPLPQQFHPEGIVIDLESITQP